MVFRFCWKILLSTNLYVLLNFLANASDTFGGIQEDSIMLWKQIISHPLLQNTQIVLFLNKCDLLRGRCILPIEDLLLICIGQPNSRLALNSAILFFPMGKDRMITSLLQLVRVIMRCYADMIFIYFIHRSSKKVWWVKLCVMYTVRTDRLSKQPYCINTNHPFLASFTVTSPR